jgi:hypothetical protein
MAPKLIAAGRKTDVSSTPKGYLFATDGNVQEAARRQTTSPHTSALVAGARSTGLNHVLAARRLKSLTPYKPEVWRRLLEESDLLSRYPSIPDGLSQGFSGGIPPIAHTYSPPNSNSITEYGEVFQNIVEKEYMKGRFIGPFTARELKCTISKFQTAPLSLVPKPGLQIQVGTKPISSH